MNRCNRRNSLVRPGELFKTATELLLIRLCGYRRIPPQFYATNRGPSIRGEDSFDPMNGLLVLCIVFAVLLIVPLLTFAAVIVARKKF